MCSIFGTNITDVEKLKKMGIAGEVRGKDATGVATLTSDKIYIHKNAVKASKFEWGNLPTDGEFYLGHTRKTTKGDENQNQNNHPFISNDNSIVLAHNGIISNDKVNRTYKTDIETDSFSIVQQLEKEKGENPLNIEVVKKVCEKLSGSFALSILDITTDKLYLLRHKNPLKILYSQSGNLIYASLEKMIREGWEKETQFGTFIGQIEENLIYEFDLQEKKFVNQETFTAIAYTTGYRKKGNYYNNNNKQISKYLNRHDFNPKKPQFYGKQYTKCDCCGIWYKDSFGIKAGKKRNIKVIENEKVTELAFNVCKFCDEGKINKYFNQSGNTKSFEEKVKEILPKNVEIYKEKDEKKDKENDMSILNEEEFGELNHQEKQNYTWCFDCGYYYHQDEEVMFYHKDLQLFICGFCKTSHYESETDKLLDMSIKT